MATEPTYVDNTLLTCMAQCDTKTILRHVLGMTSREERAALVSGSAAHESMAAYFRTGDMKHALVVFEEGEPCMQCADFKGLTAPVGCSRCKGTRRQTPGYRVWSDANLPADDRLRYELLREILQIWYTNHPIARLPFRPRAEWVEIGFAYPLTDAGDLVFCGRLDAIVEEPDSVAEVRILDNKFTGALDNNFVRNFQMDSQFSGYLWAAQRTLGRKVLGGYVNAISTARLPSDPERKCNTHKVAFAECRTLPDHAKSQIFYVDRTPDKLESWRQTAVQLGRKFQVLKRAFADRELLPLAQQQGQFIYKACSWCEAHDFCVSGRPTQFLDSLFQYSPWAPYERVDWYTPKEGTFDGANAA